MLSDLLMFVGGSSGSTAGGVKTVTMGLVVLSAVNTMRGKRQVTVFGRSISQEDISNAVSVALLVMGLSLLGAAVITEDSISQLEKPFRTTVLNQWTYHARLYSAAKFVAQCDPKDLNINLVQLVSFGCGVDAITTDEVRRILELKGKYYTQIKIDEIANLGAVKIRLRSLKAVI